ncbi:MAG: flagellar hook-length control protein FliK [Alphaproteobacteria bacterium]|nr:flagellar hook-length control protein FliK [Alphaproteobacteria bacterium]
MPTINTSSSSDYSPRSHATSAGEEGGNDVLFAALFGAVTLSDDAVEANVNLETPPGMMPEDQSNAQKGEDHFTQILVFAGTEEEGLDDTGVSLLPQPLNVDDEGDATSLSDGAVFFEKKEEVDAGILAATQMPEQAQAANARPLHSAGNRPLTTQLLTEIAEDLAPEHVVIKQKVSVNAGQTAAVNRAEMMPLQADKALSVMTAPRQMLRTKHETSGPLFIELPKEEFGSSSDEMIEALTLKSAKTASQASLPLRPVAPQLPTTEASTLLQNGLASQASPSAGNQTPGGQTGGNQAGAGHAGLTSSMAENWLEMLDMQDENWAEQLVKRVERNLANAKEGIDFELNPRTLGKLHVNLSLQQNEAQLQMRTETLQAAQMITEAQSRLSAMLEDMGMKLAYLGTSTQSNGNGANGQQSGTAQHSRQNSGQNNDSDSNLHQNNDASDASNSLVNIKA